METSNILLGDISYSFFYSILNVWNSLYIWMNCLLSLLPKALVHNLCELQVSRKFNIKMKTLKIIIYSIFLREKYVSEASWNVLSILYKRKCSSPQMTLPLKWYFLTQRALIISNTLIGITNRLKDIIKIIIWKTITSYERVTQSYINKIESNQSFINQFIYLFIRLSIVNVFLLFIVFRDGKALRL